MELKPCPFCGKEVAMVFMEFQTDDTDLMGAYKRIFEEA